MSNITRLNLRALASMGFGEFGQLAPPTLAGGQWSTVQYNLPATPVGTALQGGGRYFQLIGDWVTVDIPPDLFQYDFGPSLGGLNAVRLKIPSDSREPINYLMGGDRTTFAFGWQLRSWAPAYLAALPVAYQTYLEVLTGTTEQLERLFKLLTAGTAPTSFDELLYSGFQDVLEQATGDYY